MTCDLTCVITGHQEARMSIASLRSFWAAIAFARGRGYTVQPLLFLDRPDSLTEKIFEEYRLDALQVHQMDAGDQGKVRNAAVALAQGRYTAFLDADDLWSRDWLVQALEFLSDKPEGVIAHPAYNYFFEGQATIFCQIDQEAPEFSMDMLRAGNYWDALCVCPTQIYRDHPFCDRDIAGGWAFEDWHWNCETIASGCLHKIVPDSVLFKRRQASSQTVKASGNRSMIRPSPLSRYDSSVYAAPSSDGILSS